MSDLTPKGIPLVGETDADKRASVNAALQKVDELLDDVPGGTGGTGAVVTTLSVAATKETWTDTGIVLDGTDALTIEAFGDVTNDPGVTATPIQSDGGPLRFHAVIVAAGVTPVNDMTGQFDYRLSAKMSRKAGRVWVRVRDTTSGYSNNIGTVTATLNYYEDASKAVATATVISVAESQTVSAIPYDISVFAGGKPVGGNAVLDRVVIPRPFISTAGAGLANLFRSFAAAAASTSFTITQASLATPNTPSPVYTLTWAMGATVPTITGNAVTWAAGDIMRFVGPATADATLADIVGTVTGVTI